MIKKETKKETKNEIKKQGLSTVEKFAEMVEKSPTQVRSWIKDGILSTEVIKNRKYIILGQSLLRLYKYYEEKANSKEEKKDREHLQNELLQANIDHKNLMIELQSIRRDIQTGKYISTEKVKEANSKFLSIFKNFALSIPSQLIGMVAAKLDKQIVRETQANLEKQIKNMLVNFVDNGRLEEEQIENGKIELNEKGEEKKRQGRSKS